MKLNQHKSTMMFFKWMNFILLLVIKNKVWLIYAYHQKIGQMVAFVLRVIIGNPLILFLQMLMNDG